MDIENLENELENEIENYDLEVSRINKLRSETITKIKI